jgi:hypothetical protein
MYGAVPPATVRSWGRHSVTEAGLLIVAASWAATEEKRERKTRKREIRRGERVEEVRRNMVGSRGTLCGAAKRRKASPVKVGGVAGMKEEEGGKQREREKVDLVGGSACTMFFMSYKASKQLDDDLDANRIQTKLGRSSLLRKSGGSVEKTQALVRPRALVAGSPRP